MARTLSRFALAGTNSGLKSVPAGTKCEGGRAIRVAQQLAQQTPRDTRPDLLHAVKIALALAGREVVSYLLARGRGGIGRRVRFRSVWGQPREGSSPFARTTIYQRFCLAQAAFFMSRPHSGSHRQLLPVRATRVRSIQRRALPLLGEGYDVLISVADVRQVVCHSLDHHDAQATDSDFID